MSDDLLKRLAELRDFESIEHIGDGVYQHVRRQKYKQAGEMIDSIRTIPLDRLLAVERMGDSQYRVTFAERFRIN